MTQETPTKIRSDLSVDHITRLDEADLESLVNATMETIADGHQSSWRGKPSTERLKAFWNGVALSPQRYLIIGRLSSKAVGAVQIVQAGPLSEIGPEVASLDNFFLAPSARGHGLARRMLRYAENVARAQGIISLDFVVREDRSEAVSILENMGYRQWARKDTFRMLDDQFQAGLFYTKVIDEDAVSPAKRTSAA